MAGAHPVKSRRDRHSSVVSRYPIAPVRTEADYDRATAVLQELLGHEDLNQEQQDYVEVMSILIHNYETEKYADFFERGITPIAALKYLMEANGMTVGDIGKIIGSPSYASMILKGDREISKENARKLADRFHVDAGLFI